ncbi:hypothetical protein [Chitinolyticbacter meiyuanensis]|nr:hypothetical protein [Chitinolyticbacter meiyuanensis]
MGMRTLLQTAQPTAPEPSSSAACCLERRLLNGGILTHKALQ